MVTIFQINSSEYEILQVDIVTPVDYLILRFALNLLKICPSRQPQTAFRTPTTHNTPRKPPLRAPWPNHSSLSYTF